MLKIDFKTVFNTDRLVLRGRKVATLKMAKSFSQLIQQNTSFLKQWVKLAWKDNSVENSLLACQKSARLWRSGIEADYNIFLKDNTLIGQINIKDISYKTKSCEIGYYLGEQYTRHGYIQEAIFVLEEYIFSLGIERIQICTDNKNIPSQKLAKKCGYQLEGVLRQNALGPDGQEIRDTVFFSKLKSDI